MKYTKSHRTKYHQLLLLLCGIVVIASLALAIRYVSSSKKPSIAPNTIVSNTIFDFLFSVSFFNSQQVYKYNTLSYQKQLLFDATDQMPPVNIELTDQKTLVIATDSNTALLPLNYSQPQLHVSHSKDKYFSPNGKYSFSLIGNKGFIIFNITNLLKHQTQQVQWQAPYISFHIIGWSNDNNTLVLASNSQPFLLDMVHGSIKPFILDKNITSIKQVLLPKNSNTMYFLTDHGLYLQKINENAAQMANISSITKNIDIFVINDENPEEIGYIENNIFTATNIYSGEKRNIFKLPQNQSITPMAWNHDSIVYLSQFRRTDQQYELDANYINLKDNSIHNFIYLNSNKPIPTSSITFIAWLKSVEIKGD